MELRGGTVLLSIPADLDAADTADLRDWLTVVLRRLERKHPGTGSESASGLGQCNTSSPARELSDEYGRMVAATQTMLAICDEGIENVSAMTFADAVSGLRAAYVEATER